MSGSNKARQISVRTRTRQQFVDITGEVAGAISESGVSDGVAVVFTPHTTAGITINENADPDVVHDLELVLDKVCPDMRGFRHAEGNSDAHARSTFVGCSETILIQDGRPILGTWQGIYFCEFDGPRTRKVWIKTIQG